jgi:hypothetical protein
MRIRIRIRIRAFQSDLIRIRMRLAKMMRIRIRNTGITPNALLFNLGESKSRIYSSTVTVHVPYLTYITFFYIEVDIIYS